MFKKLIFLAIIGILSFTSCRKLSDREIEIQNKIDQLGTKGPVDDLKFKEQDKVCLMGSFNGIVTRITSLGQTSYEVSYVTTHGVKLGYFYEYQLESGFCHQVNNIEKIPDDGEEDDGEEY